MGQVFISYKTEERERAKEIDAGLSALGVETWWDEKLPPGSDWQERIDTALQNCDIIVVVWTEASMKSKHVRAEAKFGFDEDKLIPIRLDGVRIPYPFYSIQTEDLRADPLTSDERWSAIVEEIQQRLERRDDQISDVPETPRAAQSIPAQRKKSSEIDALVRSILIMSAGIMVFIAWTLLGDQISKLPNSSFVSQLIAGVAVLFFGFGLGGIRTIRLKMPRAR